MNLDLENTKIVHFNDKVLLEKLGGNTLFLLEISNLGIIDLKDNKTQIELLLPKNNTEVLNEVIHKLKGTANTMNFEYLKHLIEIFEISENNTDTKLTSVNKILIEIDFLIDVISKPKHS